MAQPVTDLISRSVAIRARGGRRAAILVSLSGATILTGSFLAWGFGGPDFFFSGAFRSGMDAGPGLVTVLIGALLWVLGFTAFRQGGTSPFRVEGIALALFALLSVAAFMVGSEIGRELWVFAPREGAILVAVGAVVGLAASSRLRPPDQATDAWAHARRPALALLIVGIEAWVIGLSGHLGLRVAPLTYAIALVGLGVGLWPGRLAATRLKPPTLGLLIVLYGAASLAAAVFGGAGRAPLEAMPVAVLLAVVVLRVLELPIETPDTRSTPGRIDAALEFVGSTSGLRVAALLLTGAALALLVARFLAAGNLPLWLYAIEDLPTDPAWLVWLLVAGLALGMGTAIALVRRPAMVD